MTNHRQLSSAKPLAELQSDSGPIGAQIEDALGLSDDENVIELLPETRDAILAEGLTDLKRIGRGGYGVVMQAVDSATGNPRAVKVMINAGSPDRLTIFNRECRMLDTAEMPAGIAPKFYKAVKPLNAQPFLIQEWISGQKLSDWLDARPKLPMTDRESLCRLIFATYAKLHQANLIHRDVSLGNIMVSGRQIRLIDFGGGARAVPGYRSHNTMSQVPTTEAFVSDAVRLRERKPSIADEVHAVAKVCFTVLTNQLAFGKSSTEWKRILKFSRVAGDIASIVLSKMQEPPHELAMHSQAREF